MVLGLNGRGVVVVCAVFLFTPHAWAQTGACCLNDTGACISATEADCNGSLQGAWQGAGMTCADDMPCSTTYGACCLPDECRTAPMFVCSVLANEGAEFMGEGVACHETTYAETVLGDGHWIDMTGATPIVFVDDESGFGTTDEGMAQVTLPAPYVFDSVSYSAGATVWVHTNGFVSFDIIDVTNRPDTFNFRLEFSADASTPNGAICPLWSDQNNTTARTKTVMQGADTVLVIEWDTTPFSAESFGGKYQLHLITTGGTGADEIRVVYRETMGGATPFDGLLAEDNRLFVGAHSVGGLSVFRRDVASLRTLIDSGAHGLLFTPTGTETPCDVNVCAADFNNDGDVDLGDFGTFGSEFNRVDCIQ